LFNCPIVDGTTFKSEKKIVQKKEKRKKKKNYENTQIFHHAKIIIFKINPLKEKPKSFKIYILYNSIYYN